MAELKDFYSKRGCCLRTKYVIGLENNGIYEYSITDQDSYNILIVNLNSVNSTESSTLKLTLENTNMFKINTRIEIINMFEGNQITVNLIPSNTQINGFSVPFLLGGANNILTTGRMVLTKVGNNDWILNGWQTITLLPAS